MQNGLFSALLSHANPEDTALSWRDGPETVAWTYAQVAAQSSRWANALRARGAKPGERLVVQIEKQPEAVFLYLGCLRTGATYVPLNPAYSREELDYLLSDADPLLSITEADMADWISEVTHAGSGFEDTPAGATHPAAMLYSSGTTGRPKGIMLSEGALLSNAHALTDIWQVRADDVLLHALPLFHTHGLFVALNTLLLSGGRVDLLPRFDPAAVLTHLPHATLFMGVPTFYGRLLKETGFSQNTVANLRHAICGSAPLTDEVFGSFEARTGHSIIERYGMTEAGIITAVRPGQAKAAGTVGHPLPKVHLRISTPDETGIGGVEIKSEGLFSGYWNLADKTAEEFTADGWFKTGDLGRMDEDGALTITGRAKDLIISGGYNVYPKEIERAIDALPGVIESAVVGMPHPDFGEAGLAVLVGQDLDLEAVRSELKAGLANYKVPKLFVETGALPRNAMGKVQKTVLQATYSEAWKNALSQLG